MERAREGDERALEAITATGRHLGVGIAGIINAVDPGRIIVGGATTRAWNVIEPLIEGSIRERALTSAAAEMPVGVDPDHGRTRLCGAAPLVVAPAFAAPDRLGSDPSERPGRGRRGPRPPLRPT